MKDTFDLRNFLIENKLTEGSRKNDMRVRFNRNLLENNGFMQEARMGDSDFDIFMPAGEGSFGREREDDDFVDPEELEECDDINESKVDDNWPVEDIRKFYTAAMNGYKEHNRAVEAGEIDGVYIPNIEQKVFKQIQKRFGDPEFKIVPIKAIFKDRITARDSDLAASRRAVTRFKPKTDGGTFGSIDQYTGHTVVDEPAPTVMGRKQRGAHKDKYDKFGNNISLDKPIIDEAGFEDTANSAARNSSDAFDTPDEDSTSSSFDSPTGAAFGSTTELPDDFSKYDEPSIRRSYQSLKNQRVSDDKAMKILSKTYDIPEQDLRSMFRDVFLNARQRAVQVDDPKSRVGMTLSKRKAGELSLDPEADDLDLDPAAEKTAARDAATSGDFDDDYLDQDDTVDKPQDDDFEDEPEDNTPVDKNAPDYRKVDIASNIELEMSENELQKYLNGFKRPEAATTFLQRALNVAQKEASRKGSGNLYMYLCSDGYYHTLNSQHSIGDEITFKRKTAEYKANTKKFMATIDCSGAPSLSKVERPGVNGTEPEDSLDTEMTPSELYKIAHSPRWDKMTMKQKLQDPAWPYSDEAKEMADDDEPVDSEFANNFTNDEDEEDGIDWTNPADRDWALKWLTKESKTNTDEAPIEPEEMTPGDLHNIAHSPRWREMTTKQKIQDPAWRYSDEGKDMPDDEPVDDEFADDFVRGEKRLDWSDPADRDWASKWVAR